MASVVQLYGVGYAAILSVVCAALRCELFVQPCGVSSLCSYMVSVVQFYGSVGSAAICCQFCSYMLSVIYAAIWCQLFPLLNGVGCTAICCHLLRSYILSVLRL